jgi:hypothetical protein
LRVARAKATACSITAVGSMPPIIASSSISANSAAGRLIRIDFGACGAAGISNFCVLIDLPKVSDYFIIIMNTV